MTDEQSRGGGYRAERMTGEQSRDRGYVAERMTSKHSRNVHKQQAYICVTITVFVLVLTRVVLSLVTRVVLSVFKFTATIKTYCVLSCSGT